MVKVKAYKLHIEFGNCMLQSFSDLSYIIALDLADVFARFFVIFIQRLIQPNNS